MKKQEKWSGGNGKGGGKRTTSSFVKCASVGIQCVLSGVGTQLNGN